MCIAISMWDNNLSRILAFIASGSQVLWYFGKTCKYYVFAVLFDLRIQSFPDDPAQPSGMVVNRNLLLLRCKNVGPSLIESQFGGSRSAHL